MNITVRLFAVVRDLVGEDQLVVDLEESASIGNLRAAMLQRSPQLGNVLSSAMFAANHQYVADDFVLVEGMEVACIPPVSGG